MDCLLVLKISAFMLIFLVSEIPAKCTQPTTCVKAGDECSDITEFINCRNGQSRDCPQSVRHRNELSIKILKRTYEKSPFNCVFSRGSSCSTSGLVIFTAVVTLGRVCYGVWHSL